MGTATHLDLFRRGLLERQVLTVAGAGGPVADAVAGACEGLGATVERYEGEPRDEAAAAAFTAGVVERHGGLHTLVVDAGSAFTAAAQSSSPDEAAAPGVRALRAAADPAWIAARAAATGAMIEAEEGKIVMVAPPPGGGPRARATRAALENLARTLSIEWSRYTIRTATILPGDATTPEQIGAVVAFLASPAGDYYSGCVLDLTGPG